MAIIYRKRVLKYVLVLLFTGYLASCKSEVEIDEQEIYDSTTKKVESLYKRDSTMALALCEQLVAKYPNANYVKTLTYMIRAQVYDYWDEDSLCKTYMKKGAELAERGNYELLQAKAYLLKAQFANNFEDNISNLLKFEDVVKKININDPSLLFDYHTKYGYYHYEFKEIEKARKHFDTALKIAQNSALLWQESKALNDIAVLLNEQAKYDSSLAQINKALDICDNCCEVECGDFLFQKGLALIGLKKYKEAKNIMEEVQKSYNKNPHQHNVEPIDVILGDIFLATNDDKNALKSYEAFLRKAKFNSTKLWAYNKLSKFYEHKKQYEKQRIYQNYYFALKDSVYSSQKIALLMDMEQKFILKHKEWQQEWQKQQYWITIGVLVLILVCSSSVYWLYSRAKKAELQLMESAYDIQNIRIESKERELASNTLFLSQYADLLNTLKKEAKQLSTTTDAPQLKNISKMIDKNLQEHNDWDRFKLHFEAVSPSFFDILKQYNTNLTELDLKHCAYLKIRLTPKQVANLLGISPKSVTLARVRIKKKLRLEESLSLSDFINHI
jgi:hypothetical protein